MTTMSVTRRRGRGFSRCGCLAECRRSKVWSQRGPSSQKRNLVGTKKSREALVKRDDAIAFGALGLVPDDVIGKVAAARKHRDPGLGGGSLDFDRMNGDKTAEDVDDLRAAVSVRPL